MPPGTGDDVTALVGGRLIDGTGAVAVEDAVVVIGGDRIVAAGAAGSMEVPAGATLIDVAGKTVMPGMIEGNSHIIFDGQSNHPAYFAGRYRDYYEIGARNLNASLMQGITTSRDTMDPLEEMIRLREDVESGLIAGSRLFTSGTILNYPGVYRMFDDPTDSVFFGIPPEGVEYARAAMRLPVRDGAHGREIVADYAARGVDFIKVSSHSGPENEPPELATEALTEIVEEAHAHGLRVTTHTSSIKSIVAVLDAGVDAMEHPTLVSRGGSGAAGRILRRTGTALRRSERLFGVTHGRARGLRDLHGGPEPGWRIRGTSATLPPTWSRRPVNGWPETSNAGPGGAGEATGRLRAGTLEPRQADRRRRADCDGDRQGHPPELP